MSEGMEEPQDVYCEQKEGKQFKLEAKQFKLSLGFCLFVFLLSLKTSPCSLQSALIRCQSELKPRPQFFAEGWMLPMDYIALMFVPGCFCIINIGGKW